ncbi:hypothetical protein [Methylophilus sp. Leaf414]|uniref:hypothetical protein n=1 Tax=Methylophilus sp. Leaf414 TaxID=1736371 RepID=UPI0006FC1E53|nr:hypothetical protein [Methylophilus sp. Leaf414]
MKHYLEIFLIGAILHPCILKATEVTYCFDKAWAHPDNGRLGLKGGPAIVFCQAAKNATEVLTCFNIAYKHPDKDGLGLNLGRAR